MKLLLFLLLSIQSLAQPLVLTMKVERVCLSHQEPKESYSGKVLIAQEGENYGIYTGKDTLYLKPYKRIYVYSTNYLVYQDTEHSNQLYSFKVVPEDYGIVIFITPLKPYNRKVYSIILTL